MISNPMTGAGYFLRGLKLLGKPGIRIYFVIPFIINLLIFGGLIAVGINYLGTLIDQLLPQLPNWLQWLSWLFWLIITLATVLIIFFTFSLVANIVGAPFNGLLAEAVERYATGESPPSEAGWKKMMAELIPSLLNEVKKLAYFIAWAIPFLILFFIPVINLTAPFFWMLFSAWMLTLEYADYPMANHGLLLADVKRKVGGKRFMSLGFGGAVMIGTMIPIGNFLVMPAAVAGATLFWVEQLRGDVKGTA
jgi:CysZ protein